MKKIIVAFLCILIISLSFVGCSVNMGEKDNSKLNVVATIFPQYDFSKVIGGDKINLSLLLPPGMESHTYEPTPNDIIKIQNADIFIYTGGENDTWIDNILGGIDTSDMKIISLMNCVETVEEEIVEGMQVHEEDESESEVDEHVWTSPVNAMKICEKIYDAFIEKDEKNSQYYKDNLNSYLNELKSLDKEFREVTENSVRKTLFFGDRFPFRYFADEYALNYHAAFPGCSGETEPSAQTVAFLIDKMNEEKVPVIFHIEFSNQKSADTIAQATNSKKLLFHSCHNVSKEEMDKGVSYVSLMKQNLNNLKTALM